MSKPSWPDPGALLVARDVDNGRVLAVSVTTAATRVARAVGLLARHRFATGEGLWITPCRGVHTYGMRFSIDVVALNRSGVVVDMVTEMRPWRIRLPRRGAVGVLELPAGSVSRCEVRIGHTVALEEAA